MEAKKAVTPQDWYDKHGLKPDEDGWFPRVPECKNLPVDSAKWVENIARNIQLDVPNAKACHYNPRTMVMVCGGVTAKNYLEEIRAKSLDPAYDVFCSNKTGEWLLQNGIVPQYHMILDSKKAKVKDVALKHPDIIYLLALNCDPAVFEELKDYKIKRFFCPSNIGGEGLDRKEVDKYITEPMLMVCGGTMAGVRAITIAEGLGYRNLEYYGFDACIESKDKFYAYEKRHNEAILTVEAEDGRQFLSTHIFADQVRQMMEWRLRLPWVKFKVHGDSFMSHMLALDAKKHLPKHSLRITPEYLELQRQMHEVKNYGISGHKHAKTVHALASQLSQKYGSLSVLDYGCGQSTLKRAIDEYRKIENLEWREYDPSIAGKDAEPEPADLVVCSDVMEHIEPECLANVLDHIESLTRKLAFFWIDTEEAVKFLPDGRNAHICLRPPDWWFRKIKARFIVAESSVYDRAVAFVAQSVALTKNEYVEGKLEQVPSAEQVFEIKKDGTTAKFIVVNDVTKYRVDSLFIKEPVTIDWINRMAPGEVLFDVGANVGSYSIWAGCRGIKVFAFEPASQNYDLLCRNIVLNGLSDKVTAYCAALSNKLSLENLYLSERTVGASCNELGESVGPNLEPRRNPNIQGCVGLELDALVSGGHLPQPDHIKIDVDGFEHRVIAGAMKTLKGAKSLLVEINENLELHRALVFLLRAEGFEFKPHQVDQARRQSGPFKGCAEYLFTRERDEIDEVIDRIMAAQISAKPFPHLYLNEVFSRGFYDNLLDNLQVDYKSIEEARKTVGYPERSIHEPKSEFWLALDEKMRDGRLKSALCSKLGRYAPTFKDETLLIRDTKGYHIGPHTDSPSKVATALFYLPQDDSMPEAGTSLYVPKKNGFKSNGDRHYFFEDFDRVITMPYVPNSMFAFAKSDISFHGVEPFTRDGARNTFLYDIRT